MFEVVWEIVESCEDVEFVYLMYLNLVVREKVMKILGGYECIYLIELFDVIDFYNFLCKFYFVFIDLGGV